MRKLPKIDNPANEIPEESNEQMDPTSWKEKHLEGFSEDQKKIIKMMAAIFVNTLLHLPER